MSAFKRKVNKRAKSASKKVNRFYLGESIDLVRFLMASCFYYNLILFLYYYQYQTGRCAFQPLLYIPSIVVVFVLHEIFRYIKQPALAAAAGILVTVLVFVYYPIDRMQFLLGLVMVLCLVTEFFTSGTRIDPSGTGGAWFLRVGNTVWGTGILVTMLLHIIIADNKRNMSIKPAECLRIMSVVLCIYILLLLIYRYLKLFFDYYRRKKKIDIVMKQQVKRVAGFAGIFAAGAGILIYFISMYLAGFFNQVIGFVGGLLSRITLTANDPESTQEPLKLNEAFPNEAQQLEEHLKIGQAGPFGKILTIVFMLIFAGFILYMIFMIYKSISNMSFTREADSDSIHVVRDESFQQLRRFRKFSFYKHGSGVNESIRRYYYRMLLRFRLKGKLGNITDMTAEDIRKDLSEDKKKEMYIKEITPIYQAARYGEKDLSRQEAEKAKELCEKMTDF